MEVQVGKLGLTLLLAGVGLLVPRAPASLPLLFEVRPASGQTVVVRLAGVDSVQFRASAAGLRSRGGRLAEFVAPGTLEIIGGEGELELRSADPRVDFVLIFKRDVSGLNLKRDVAGEPRGGRLPEFAEFEARGQRAVIRVRGGDVSVDAETMTVRGARAP